MNIIETNWQWNSVLSKRGKTSYIVLHHAEAVSCTAAQVDQWHKSNGWSGIGYHFFVRKNGEIYRGRPLWAVGAHVFGMNDCSVGICAEGDYHNKDKVMPSTQKKAIKEVIAYLKTIYHDAEVVGHQDVGDSNCPGRYYPLVEMKNYDKESDTMTAEERAELEELRARVEKLENPMIYNYIDDNMPEWAREGVQWCIDNGIISGTGDGLGLDDKDLKYCTMMMRLGGQEK